MKGYIAQGPWLVSRNITVKNIFFQKTIDQLKNLKKQKTIIPENKQALSLRRSYNEEKVFLHIIKNYFFNCFLFWYIAKNVPRNI